MATDLVVGDKLQIRFFCQSGDQIGINVTYWNIVAVVAQWADYNVLANDWSADFANGYVAALSSNAKYYGMSISRRTLGTWLELATSIQGQSPGSNLGDVLPRQVSGIVTLLTGLPGRAGRGRMYIPFPSESNNLPAGHPDGPYVAALQGIASVAVIDNTIVHSLGAVGQMTIRGQLFHRATGTFTDLNGYTARARWATQKRRGDYGKPNTPPF